MNDFDYHRPASVADATRLFGAAADARYLAGGQSLLPAMKMGLSAPSDLVDVTRIAGLSGIRADAGTVTVGAGTSHAEVAASAEVRRAIPALAHLAELIGDPAVRSAGTLGGSLALNDPAACYPAGVLGLGATVRTDRREIAADDFFTGLFATALEPDEVLVGVRFAGAQALHYAKEEQPASRFALAGVAVARQAGGAVRVAVTGLGQGVFRWAEAESRLVQRFAPEALDGLRTDAGIAHGDLHASADYRCHLAGVLARRAVRRFGGAAA